MLSTGEEIRSPQRSFRSGPILAKMPCTIRLLLRLKLFLFQPEPVMPNPMAQQPSYQSFTEQLQVQVLPYLFY